MIASPPVAAGWPGLIEAYRQFLPVLPGSRVITLLEGNTPLIEAPQLAAAIAGQAPLRIFLKYEGLNPTGSFKDRGMTVAMTQAVARGAEAVICASTGNTSASAAAYASRAGVKCAVLLPHGMTAMGKLSQALIHGATVVAIQGNFDDALRLVREISQARPVALVNSVNPDRIEGQKTGAFEICDVLGDAPPFHCIPVGNAGNITAYWKGYREYHEKGRTSRLPRMLGFQAAGAAPLVSGKVVETPDTIATAIRIGNPASWHGAINARDESHGLIEAVTDDEILAAYRLLATTEGVFCEPASAASVAGLIQLWNGGYFHDTPAEERMVVCTLTGHGLKDPSTALKAIDEPKPVPAVLEAVLEAIGL
ncbi:MAG: threonine synthase [Actinomycetota bacterium]